MSDTEHAVLNVTVDNFKGIKKCPYCGVKPDKMKWEDGKISMGCRNPGCNLVPNEVMAEYGGSDLSLRDKTSELIWKWNEYCDGVTKAKVEKAKEGAE